MALEDIVNFIPIDDRLATAGQPTAAQLAEVAAAGYDVVVNLALGTPTDDLPDEAGLVRALGLAYEHIPVIWTAPTVADFDRFVAVMDARAGERRFVHCALNYRVSMFTSLYAEGRWGWSRDRADTHIRRIWEPDETWSAFIAAVRGRRDG